MQGPLRVDREQQGVLDACLPGSEWRTASARVIEEFKHELDTVTQELRDLTRQAASERGPPPGMRQVSTTIHGVETQQTYSNRRRDEDDTGVVESDTPRQQETKEDDEHRFAQERDAPLVDRTRHMHTISHDEATDMYRIISPDALEAFRTPMQQRTDELAREARPIIHDRFQVTLPQPHIRGARMPVQRPQNLRRNRK